MPRILMLTLVGLLAGCASLVLAFALPAVALAQQPIFIVPPSGGVYTDPAFSEGAAAADRAYLERMRIQAERQKLEIQHQYELERLRIQQQGLGQWQPLGRHQVTIGTTTLLCAVQWNPQLAATMVTECGQKGK